MVNKINGLLGISAKAGKIISGTDAVLEEMSKGKVKLIIVAEDASSKTIKNIKYYCDKNQVELIIYGNISDNSRAIGKNNKAIIGVKDKKLSEALLKVFHGGKIDGEN